MAKKVRRNRTRRNKASLEKYGKNPRRLQEEYKAVTSRLIYACNLLFGGSEHEFAAAVGVCYRHLHSIMRGQIRLTANMAAQIVARTGLRAEWLLCGSGSVLAATENDSDWFSLPLQLTSSFPLFDVPADNMGVDFFPPEQFLLHETPVSNLTAYKDAASAILAARANSKAVGFFLGSAAFAVPVAQFVLPFFQQRYADFLVLTLSAAAYDLQAAHAAVPIDINSVAKFAAQRGMGYGEALGAVGFSSAADQTKSLVASLRELNLPVIISAELGEIGRHSAPQVRGAEVGAAIGAAAYVDLLLYTAQLQNFFGTPGGVMVIAGDCARGVRMFLARLETLKIVEPQQTGFTFVLFSKPDDTLQTEIHISGGTVIFLDPPAITSFDQLLQTCNDVYAGNIKHERRKTPDGTI